MEKVLEFMRNWAREKDHGYSWEGPFRSHHAYAALSGYCPTMSIDDAYKVVHQLIAEGLIEV